MVDVLLGHGSRTGKRVTVGVLLEMVDCGLKVSEVVCNMQRNNSPLASDLPTRANVLMDSPFCLSVVCGGKKTMSKVRG